MPHKQIGVAQHAAEMLSDAGVQSVRSVARLDRWKLTAIIKPYYRTDTNCANAPASRRHTFGLRRSRYVGIAKTRLQHFATAAAINLERVSDWLAGIGREKTRRSAFARVMQPLTA